MEKLRVYGEEYGRTIDPREAGVLLFTHVCDDRAAAMKTVEPFFHGLRVDPEAIMRRSLIGSAQECVEQLSALSKSAAINSCSGLSARRLIFRLSSNTMDRTSCPILCSSRRNHGIARL